MRNAMSFAWQCIILLTLFACKSEVDVWEEAKIKKVSSMVGIDPPPPLLFRSTFVEGSDNSIVEINFISLWRVYTENYKDSIASFDGFLLEALNQRLKLYPNERVRLYSLQRFKVDRQIADVFKNEKLDGLKKKFCVEAKNRYLLKNDLGLTLDQVNSISYFFFLSGFIKMQNDYNATTSFVEFSRLFK